jgi:hypothetical protein
MGNTQEEHHAGVTRTDANCEVQGLNCSLYSSHLGKGIFILFSPPQRKYLKT